MSYENEFNLTSLILAQRVQLYVVEAAKTLTAGTSPTPGSTLPSGAKHLATMRGLNVNATHPRRRINQGMERFYTHAAPDITMSFTVSGDKDLVDFLQTRATRTAGGILAVYDWWVRVTSNSGNSVDRGFSGQLESINFEKPLESQDDPYDITCDIIVQQQTL